MSRIVIYLFLLFFGIPMITFAAHVATLPDDEKHALSEAVKDLNGRIYRARIECKRGSREHIMRVHGRDREDARRKLQDQVPRCNVEILEGESEPIWQMALRSVY